MGYTESVLFSGEVPVTRMLSAKKSHDCSKSIYILFLKTQIKFALCKLVGRLCFFEHSVCCSPSGGRTALVGN